MTAPLVNRLRAQIQQSADEDANAVSLAQIACYFARVGDFDEAERLRKQLREIYGDGRALEVSIVLMMLDALLLYYKDLSPASRDRMARANLIAVASSSKRWIAITAAWLAHIDFNLSRFEDMARDLVMAFGVLHADDGEAECRLALVLGDSFLYCGRVNSSQRWYERARVIANRLGDQAAIGAMIYNRSALRVLTCRLDAMTSSIEADVIANVWAEVKSASNYQIVAQTASLDHLLGSARVGALVLLGDLPKALLVIDEVLASGSVPVPSAEMLLLHADRALCMASAGIRPQAVQEIEVVVRDWSQSLSSDDAALIYWSLARTTAILGDDGAAEAYRQLALTQLDQHQAAMVELLVRIDPHSDLPQLKFP